MIETYHTFSILRDLTVITQSASFKLVRPYWFLSPILQPKSIEHSPFWKRFTAFYYSRAILHWGVISSLEFTNLGVQIWWPKPLRFVRVTLSYNGDVISRLKLVLTKSVSLYDYIVKTLITFFDSHVILASWRHQYPSN